MAYGRDSLLTASGNVDIDALNNSLIDASIFSASIAIAGGISAGLGASVGVSVARNFIGWDQNLDAASTATYTTGTAFGNVVGGQITDGQTVYVESGARAGGLYEYIGDEPLEEPEDSDPDDGADDREGWLARVDYSDKTKWKHVNLQADAALIQAFLEDTSVAAGGNLTIDADADQEIRAKVFAGAVALSGGYVGASLSGAGASTENKIKTFVKAYIDGDVEETGTSASISASDVALKADDNSTIDADTGAAAIAAGFGAGGIAVSIGVGLAQNEISNEVDSYIKNADVSTNAQFTSAQTGVAVSAGDRVVLGGDYAVNDHDTRSGAAQQVLLGDGVTVVTIYSKDRDLDRGDVVELVADYTARNAMAKDTGATSVADDKLVFATPHGLSTGEQLRYEGATENGLTNGNTYYVVYVSDTEVKLASSYANATNTSGSPAVPAPITLTLVDQADLTGKTFVTPAQAEALRPNDFVQVGADYANGGTFGKIYRYVGATPASNEYIDLANQNYGDTSKWELVGGDAGTKYTWVGNTAVTATSLTSSEFTLADHGFESGKKLIYRGATTGILQNGETYYVIKTSDNTFQLANSLANATATNPVALTLNSASGLTFEEFVDLKTQDYSGSNWAPVSGDAGATYVYQGDDDTLNLGTQEYGDASLWAKADTLGDITVEAVNNAEISALAVAASAAVSAGFVGVSVSGAGADATNIILSKTRSYVQNSDLDSARDVKIEASDTARIDATIAAISVSASLGAAGLAASIGSATAQNLVGYDRDGRNAATVEAYADNVSINAERDLVIDAQANETINALVASGSAFAETLEHTYSWTAISRRRAARASTWAVRSK